MLQALKEAERHSSAGASHGTEGPSPVEAAQAKTVESPQTENNGPPPVHTATGTESSANTLTPGSAEPKNTPAAGGVQSITTHAEAATSASTAVPAVGPTGPGQEDAPSQPTEAEVRIERARTLVREATAGLRMAKDFKSGKKLRLGNLLSGGLSASGDPLVESAPYRDRTLRDVPMLLEEDEVPFNLDEAYAAETEPVGTPVDHSKITCWTRE